MTQLNVPGAVIIPTGMRAYKRKGKKEQTTVAVDLLTAIRLTILGYYPT